MATKELQAILASYTAARARGQAAALVTVVKTAGSTYRRPGARMLVLAGGEPAGVGLISGGCLEDDARERALEVIASGRPAVIRYDTTADGDIMFGSGLGCQGVVHVLIEPLLSQAGSGPQALDFIVEVFATRHAFGLANIFSVIGPTGGDLSPRIADHLRVLDQKVAPHATSIQDPELAAAIARDVRAALRRRRPCCRTYRHGDGATVEVFLDVIVPPRALLICGAGEDARPLLRLAKELGWRVRVADPRPAYATADRFSEADEVIVCPSGAFTKRVPIEAGEAVMLMTHNFHHDLAILRTVLGSNASYIGVLGPGRRTKRLLAEIAALEGAEASLLGRKSIRRVHGPAGLDIGADAPDEIALSILAEIEAVGARRKGGALRNRRGQLHGLTTEVG